MSVLFLPKIYKLCTEQVVEMEMRIQDTSSITTLHFDPEQEDLFLLDTYQVMFYYLGNHALFSHFFKETLPVQYVFRYFPYLAEWEMATILFFPQVSYFSVVKLN